MNPSHTKELWNPVLGRLNCVYAYDVDWMWLPRFGLSTKPNPIGEIWELAEKQPFLGSSKALAVWINSADWADVLAGKLKEGEFTQLQIDTYHSYLRAIATIESQVTQALFEHYHECIELIDYGHDDFKPVASVAPLLRQCDDWQLTLPWQDSGPRLLQISCRCPWENEHGFSAEFENEQLVRTE